MSILWYLAFSGAQAVPQAERPSIKRCPDGATILASDTCPIWPDHRYLLTHQPVRRTSVERWWCGRAARPSEVSVTYFQDQPSGTPPARLEALKVHGEPPSPALLRRVRDQVAGARGLYDFEVRCISVRAGGTTPVVILRYDDHGRRGEQEVQLR